MNIDEAINGWTFEETIKTAESLMEVEKNMFKWDVIRHLRDFADTYREQLKEYQQLEEQGRLIKLPCKVRDTVYGISMGKIISLTVNEISIFCLKGEKIINAKCQNDDAFRNYVEREFGKTVFLAKSEAEEKLKELRGGE